MTGNGSKALSECRKGQHLNEISKPTELEKPLLKAFHKAAKRVQNEVGDCGRRFRLEWTRDELLGGRASSLLKVSKFFALND